MSKRKVVTLQSMIYELLRKHFTEREILVLVTLIGLTVCVALVYEYRKFEIHLYDNKYVKPDRRVKIHQAIQNRYFLEYAEFKISWLFFNQIYFLFFDKWISKRLTPNNILILELTMEITICISILTYLVYNMIKKKISDNRYSETRYYDKGRYSIRYYFIYGPDNKKYYLYGGTYYHERRRTLIECIPLGIIWQIGRRFNINGNGILIWIFKKAVWIIFEEPVLVIIITIFITISIYSFYVVFKDWEDKDLP